MSDFCQVGKQTIEEVYAEVHPELRTLLPALKTPLTEDEWAKFPEPNLRAVRQRTGS